MHLLELEEAAAAYTAFGNQQADSHRRQANEEQAQELIDSHTRLVLRFAPFISLDDQNLDPVALMETVAERLMIAAVKERMRRKYIHLEMAQEAAD